MPLNRGAACYDEEDPGVVDSLDTDRCPIALAVLRQAGVGDARIARHLPRHCDRGALRVVQGPRQRRESMTRGLVLGKFAPLHRGHQLLIERSLADCDRTVILPFYILGGPSGALGGAPN